MSRHTFDARMRVSIELALSARHRTPWLDARLESEARAIGMCGAEMDVARHGRSFDVVTGLAIALALAADETRELARTRALCCGLSDSDCDAILGFAGSVRAQIAQAELQS